MQSLSQINDLSPDETNYRRPGSTEDVNKPTLEPKPTAGELGTEILQAYLRFSAGVTVSLCPARELIGRPDLLFPIRLCFITLLVFVDAFHDA